jgi:hypothetical protein
MFRPNFRLADDPSGRIFLTSDTLASVFISYDHAAIGASRRVDDHSDEGPRWRLQTTTSFMFTLGSASGMGSRPRSKWADPVERRQIGEHQATHLNFRENAVRQLANSTVSMPPAISTMCGVTESIRLAASDGGLVISARSDIIANSETDVWETGGFCEAN